MDKTYKIALLAIWRSTNAILLSGFFFVTTSACVKEYTYDKEYIDEMMQPLAATAPDLARPVMQFAKNNIAEAASLDDRELVRRATAYDRNLLKPYNGFVVRGTVDGIILVCTGDGRRGLFEDAECSDVLDKKVWSDDNNAPCQFTLKLETACP